jgi:hypothetical protein
MFAVLTRIASVSPNLSQNLRKNRKTFKSARDLLKKDIGSVFSYLLSYFRGLFPSIQSTGISVRGNNFKILDSKCRTARNSSLKSPWSGHFFNSLRWTDDIGQANTELFMNRCNLSVSDQCAVHKNVERFSGITIQLNDRTGLQL